MRLSAFAVSVFSFSICVSSLMAAPYSWYPRATVLSGTAVNLTWQDNGGYAPDYWRIFRDGALYAIAHTTSYTDTALSPGESHSYTIESFSTQTYSIPSRTLTVTTKKPDNSFVLDGTFDFSSYTWIYPVECNCYPSGPPFYAALRGHVLYVATASPGGGNQSSTDWFVLISDVLDPSLTTPGPWAKGGAIAIPPGKPFIGAESTNDFVGWFNAPASARVVRSSSASGYIEGTIDLVETFGYIPPRIYVAVLVYKTADGGQLVWQAPYRVGLIDQIVAPDEFLTLDTAALRDDDADGILDLTDPSKGLKLSIAGNADGSVTLSFPLVPYRNYTLDRILALDEYHQYGPVWSASPLTGEFTESYTDSYRIYYSNMKAFYKLSVQEPLQ
jgi:hypothetical protein